LGALLLIAAGGYLIDSGTQLLFPGFVTISLFTFVGELVFRLWLVIRGVNITQWRQVTLAQEAV
jgi:hypothetical protein